MAFDADEIQRMQFAQLVLLGVQPSEVRQLDEIERLDLLNIAAAQAALRQGKMPE